MMRRCLPRHDGMGDAKSLRASPPHVMAIPFAIVIVTFRHHSYPSRHRERSVAISLRVGTTARWPRRCAPRHDGMGDAKSLRASPPHVMAIPFVIVIVTFRHHSHPSRHRERSVAISLRVGTATRWPRRCLPRHDDMGDATSLRASTLHVMAIPLGY